MVQKAELKHLFVDAVADLRAQREAVAVWGCAQTRARVTIECGFRLGAGGGVGGGTVARLAAARRRPMPES